MRLTAALYALAAVSACGCLSSAATGQPAAGRPRTVTLDAKPTPAQSTAIRTALRPEPYGITAQQWRDIDLFVGQADLNDDGALDLLVSLQGGMWCGSGGCSSCALLASGRGYSAKVVDLPNHSGTVVVRPTKLNGMHDLSFDDSRHVFRFKGGQYQ